MHAAALTQLANSLLCRQSSLSRRVAVVNLSVCTKAVQPRRTGKAQPWFVAAGRHRTLASSCTSAMDVAVIGAGVAGLVAVRELLREGHRVTVFEQDDDIGGVWKYTADAEDDPLGIHPDRRRVHSSMYAGLRTNLPREVMAFQDLPFLPHAMQGRSRDSRQFPSHEEVYSYLKAYAEIFQLEQHVQFQTRVVRAAPVATSPAIVTGTPAQPSNGSSFDASARASSNGMVGSRDIPPSEQRWQVTTAPAHSGKSAAGAANAADAADTHVTRIFDALLVCNGHFSEPRLPDAAGSAEFPGRQMHSHNYREAGAFAGQRVVVVGAAASGEDIAREIAHTAAEVYISSKTWAGPGLAAEGPRRNLRRLPAFQGLAPNSSVLFAQDQVVERVDTVVYATGYAYSFPFLDETNIVSVEDNRRVPDQGMKGKADSWVHCRVAPLYQHMWPPRYSPRLSFIGLPWKVLPFRQCELQARWVARVLSGRVALPPAAEMEERVHELNRQQEAAGMETRFAHRLDGDKQWQYNKMLVDACGPDVAHMPEWCYKLYEEAGHARKARPGEYRDESLDQQSVEQAHRDAEVVAQDISVAA